MLNHILLFLSGDDELCHRCYNRQVKEHRHEVATLQTLKLQLKHGITAEISNECGSNKLHDLKYSYYNFIVFHMIIKN